jgi:hypothetical protein
MGSIFTTATSMGMSKSKLPSPFKSDLLTGRHDLRLEATTVSITIGMHVEKVPPLGTAAVNQVGCAPVGNRGAAPLGIGRCLRLAYLEQAELMVRPVWHRGGRLPIHFSCERPRKLCHGVFLHKVPFTQQQKKRIPILRLYEEIRLRFGSVSYCQPVRIDQAYRVNRYGCLWCEKSYAHHSPMATKQSKLPPPLPTGQST